MRDLIQMTPLFVLLLAGCAPSVRQKTHSADEIMRMRRHMAEQLVRSHDYGSAAVVLKDLVAQEPKSARMHLLLGIVLREKGALAAAEKETRLALRLSPKDPDGWTALGVLLMRRGRYDEAVGAHQKAIALAPKVARYHNDLGFCLLVQRKYEEAKRELMEAIRLDPSLRVAFNNLGLVLGLSGEMESAMKAFGQAGGRAMALTNMGYVEELRGRPAHARRYYERALLYRRDYKPALNNLRILDPSGWGTYAVGQGAGSDETKAIDRVKEKANAPAAGAAAGAAAGGGKR